MPFSERVLEHAGGDAGMTAHADADHRDFHNVGRAFDIEVTDVDLGLFQNVESPRQFAGVDRERHVRVLAVGRDVLDDHVDVDAGIGQGPEDARRDARLIVHLEKRDLGLVLGVRDAAHDLLFHDLFLVANDGSDIFDIVEF